MGRLMMSGFFGRFFASLLLVLVTYNPSGLSFASWLAGNFPHVQPAQAVVGLALLGFWIFFVVWMVSSWGWFASPSHTALIWMVLFVVACMLTIGLCWGLVRARVSGQAVVEEVSR